MKKHFKDIKAIIILGPPGSGKGTQAELLAGRTDFYHFETSKFLDKNFSNVNKGDFVRVGDKTISLFNEKKIRENGGLVDPVLIVFWMAKEIELLVRQGKRLIFSGSPRTLYEVEKELPLFKKLFGLKSVRVIFLTLSSGASIWRNSHRRSCEFFRHPILYSPETANLKKCPLDGSRLITRKDDNAEVIKIRLKEYQDRTLPVINYLEKHGIKINEVNGDKPVAEVFGDILRVLELE